MACLRKLSPLYTGKITLKSGDLLPDESGWLDRCGVFKGCLASLRIEVFLSILGGETVGRIERYNPVASRYACQRE